MSAELITDESKKLEVENAEEVSTEGSIPLIGSKPFMLILILALTYFTYAATLSYEFVYDDVTQIVSNHRIKDWTYLPDYFVSHIWVHRDPGENGNYYRPVFLIWLLVNYKLLGLNTWGWHFVTLLTHLIATLALFLLAERLTRDRLTAFFAALIFGLHPVHIETVAWVSGVTEQLMAIPLIFAFLAYLNNREGQPKARLWFALSLVLYSIAQLEKETSLVFIGFIFTYEWLFKKDEQKTYIQRAMWAARRTAPYVAVAALYLVVRMIALNGFSHVQKENQHPLSVILLTVPSVIWGYIKLLIFPFGLSADYDSSMVTSPWSWNFYFPTLILILIAAGLWMVSRRKPVVQFTILLFILPILPVLNLRIFGVDFLHDRYLYMPSIGFSLLLAMAIRRLNPGEEKLFGLPARYVVSTALLAGLLVPAVSFQTSPWHDDVSLHYHRVQTAPSRSTLRFNFADVLFERGRYKEAAEQYEKLIELLPGQYTSNARVGLIALMSKDYDKAERHLRQALKTAPGKNSNTHLLLGFVLKDTGRLDEAMQSLRLALKINPNTPNAHYGLGLILKRQGKAAKALEEFNAELTINPDLPRLRDYIAETEALVKESSLPKQPLQESVKQQAKLQK